MSMWVVEVDPEVSMSLQWQEVTQIRHHVIKPGMCRCMYMCTPVERMGAS